MEWYVYILGSFYLSVHAWDLPTRPNVIIIFCLTYFLLSIGWWLILFMAPDSNNLLVVEDIVSSNTFKYLIFIWIKFQVLFSIGGVVWYLIFCIALFFIIVSPLLNFLHYHEYLPTFFAFITQLYSHIMELFIQIFLQFASHSINLQINNTLAY